MLTSLINVQYCYDYLVNQIPVNLLFYSHLTVVVASLIFGIYLLSKSRTLPSIMFFLVCLSFAIWSLLDFGAWFSFIGSGSTMFTWELTYPFILLFFFFSYYFLYTFSSGHDLPSWQKFLGLVALAPIFISTFFGYSLTSYNGNYCEAIARPMIDNYFYIVQCLLLFIVVNFTIVKVTKTKEKIKKKEILLAGLGIITFLAFFFSTTYVASLLVDNNIWANAYNLEIYGLFGVPLLLGSIVYLIVKYKAFDIKLIGAQALVWSLIILVGSQFFYQANIPVSSLVLTGVTLVLSAIVGFIIVRSVKKEVALREQLEIANNNQQALIHFISHQIKGFFTKSKMVFSGLLEGDFGEVTQEVKDVAKLGLDSDNNAVAMVQDILGASNLKKGTTDYSFKLADVTLIVKKVADNFRPDMEKKGLKLETDISILPLPSMVDETQITQVFKNLMDNSLRYTPSGEIKVSLKPSPNDKRKMLFIVKDTGVGLSDKDKAKLFTEGGKGEESLKVNTNSTGYGLYIVKKIVESHGGRIWAESAGRGHGSQFCVELKLSA